jgi:hypothetical protein
VEDTGNPLPLQELDTLITEIVFDILGARKTEEDEQILKQLEPLGLEMGMRMYWEERRKMTALKICWLLF